MMPASALYRIPRCTSPSQTEELLRYARLEHGAANLEWAVPTSPSRVPRTVGVRGWLASHLRLLRTAATPASTAPLRPGLAAVHLDQETMHRTAKDNPRAAADHPSELLPGSAVLLAAQPCHPDSDETCTCDV